MSALTIHFCFKWNYWELTDASINHRRHRRHFYKNVMLVVANMVSNYKLCSLLFQMNGSVQKESSASVNSHTHTWKHECMNDVAHEMFKFNLKVEEVSYGTRMACTMQLQPNSRRRIQLLKEERLTQLTLRQNNDSYFALDSIRVFCFAPSKRRQPFLFTSFSTANAHLVQLRQNCVDSTIINRHYVRRQPIERTSFVLHITTENISTGAY